MPEEFIQVGGLPFSESRPSFLSAHKRLFRAIEVIIEVKTYISNQ